MADLVVTAANVVEGSAPQTIQGFAGETITAGMSVYQAANGRWMKAKCGGTSIEAGVGTLIGIAVVGSLNNQPITVQIGGQVNVGATLTVGVIYCISATYGGLAPIADMVSTNKLTLMGLAVSASALDMSYARQTGVTMP